MCNSIKNKTLQLHNWEEIVCTCKNVFFVPNQTVVIIEVKNKVMELHLQNSNYDFDIQKLKNELISIIKTEEKLLIRRLKTESNFHSKI